MGERQKGRERDRAREKERQRERQRERGRWERDRQTYRGGGRGRRLIPCCARNEPSSQKRLSALDHSSIQGCYPLGWRWCRCCVGGCRACGQGLDPWAALPLPPPALHRHRCRCRCRRKEPALPLPRGCCWGRLLLSAGLLGPGARPRAPGEGGRWGAPPSAAAAPPRAEQGRRDGVSCWPVQ